MAGAVLVHGANHGPWCWERVVQLLEEQGIAVEAPDMYADGNPTSPIPVQKAVDCLAGEGPVVVVGHSFGGLAISGLSGEGIGDLVYLAAVVPDGDPWFEGTPTTPWFPDCVVIEDGKMTPKPERLRDLWYGDCSDEDIAWASANLRSHSVAPPPTIEHPAWKDIRSTYVICEKDGSATQEYQEAAARRIGRSVRWPTGHCPMISRPDLVASLVVSLASAGD
ncbi:MAG TPA: alpha/beta hydrolase [Acidimicrobiales bacterium]|nr:alpha/beta hydrolase [Acidimicrobiales bacterium]